MNTSKLQEKFPAVYEDFYRRSAKTVSAPHSFFLIGDFSGFYGGLTILQKVPLRFYVGLEKISTDKFEIEREFPAYFPYKNKFEKITLEKHLVEILETELAERFKGYRLHFLSEATLGLSLGGLGAISACLSELALPGQNFDQKFDFAWKLSSLLQQGRQNGATVFAAMKDTSYPVVFYSQDKSWWGKSLDEMFALNGQNWPIDFGLIFSGSLVRGQAVIASAQEVENSSRDWQKEIDKILEKKSKSFWPVYLQMLDQVSYKTLIDLKNMFLRGADERSISDFFDSLNQYQNLLHFIGVITSDISKIYSGVHKISNRTENGLGSGCKLTGVGKGGEVVFAVPFGRYREKIEAMAKSLAKETSDPISLDYTNFNDSIESNGVIIEQDLESNNYSCFIKKGMYRLDIVGAESQSVVVEGEAEAATLCDLLVNLDKMKILCHGKKVTSSQIPSQKAAAEIISNILKKEDLVLRNDEISKSYALSRFDLQSKITNPLNKLCGIEFEISGTSFESYELKLKSYNLKIGILSKIG